MMKNAFYFALKAIFLSFCLDFLVIYKNGLIRKTRLMFENLSGHSLINKQLQYTYCLIPQEVKAIRQSNTVS